MWQARGARLQAGRGGAGQHPNPNPNPGDLQFLNGRPVEEDGARAVAEAERAALVGGRVKGEDDGLGRVRGGEVRSDELRRLVRVRVRVRVRVEARARVRARGLGPGLGLE